MSEFIKKVGSFLKGPRRDSPDVYLEKLGRERKREQERKRKKVADFEERLATPAVKKRIDELVEKFGLQKCERGVESSALTFGDDKLRLVFRPKTNEFRRIIYDTIPALIHYKGLNEDDDGVFGIAYVELGKDVVIVSDEYLFGYSGLNNLCEQLGYKDEREYTGHFGRDMTGQFSI